MQDREHLLQRVKQSVRSNYPDAQIILFGSRARNEASANSDWDFLVLLNTDNMTSEIEKSVRHPLYRIEWETGQLISTLIRPIKYWESALYKETELYKNVSKEGIKI